MRSKANEDYLGIVACFGLVLVAPLSGFAQSGLTPILTQLSEHFGDGAESLVRLMVSGLSSAMIIGALLGGVIADRFGHLRTVFVLLVLYAVAGAGGYLLDNIYAMIGSRLILGVANSALGVVVAALITTRVAPDAREKWLGYLIVSGTAGATVLVWLAGVVASSNWRQVFLIHLLAVPVLLWIMFAVPQSSRVSNRPTADRSRKAGPIPIGITAFGAACGAACATGFVFVPFHLAKIGFGSPENVATAIIVQALVGAIAAYAYGWVRTRLALVPILVLGFALIASGMLNIGLCATYSGTLIGMTLVGAGTGLIAPSIVSASATLAAPDRQAQTIGFARAGFYGGPLLGQLCLEPVARYFGPSGALIGLSAFAGVMAAVVLTSANYFQPRVPTGDAQASSEPR